MTDEQAVDVLTYAEAFERYGEGWMAKAQADGWWPMENRAGFTRAKQAAATPAEVCPTCKRPL